MSDFKLIHGSCADQTADAVVNAANSGLRKGGGICKVIFDRCGTTELTQACSKKQTPVKDGDAVITPAFKAADFDSVMLFERVAIKQGRIIIGFGNNMAEYLRKLPEAQYPRALLSISARQPNAYRIGFKMAEHYNNDNNHRRGTCKRLKVSSLLSVTDLPTIEDLRNETEKKTGKKKDNSRQWATRIKKPLEDALEVLTGKVISDWKYTKAKGEELTGQEEPSTDNINELIDLYDSEIYNLL